jgi:hypothetical protein
MILRVICHEPFVLYLVLGLAGLALGLTIGWI